MTHKIPFWETREFRWLVLVLVMTGALIAVLYFEIMPLMESREQPEAAPVEGGIDGALPIEDEFVKDPADRRWGGMLAGVEDWTPIENASPQYLALLEYLSKAPPDAFAKEARPAAYSLLERAVAKLRGRALIVKAILLDSRAIALEKKAGDIEFIYRAWLVDASAREGYVVDFIKPLPYMEKKTPVSAEGLLFKLGTYEVKQGLKAAVHLVGYKLEVVPGGRGFEEARGDFWYLGAAMIAFCLLLFTLWVFFQTRQRRRARPPAAPPA